MSAPKARWQQWTPPDFFLFSVDRENLRRKIMHCPLPR
jgi:hypothetical protein